MKDEAIGKYLSIARRAHTSFLDKELGPYDINHGQILILVTLYQQDGICQQTICQMYNLNKAGVNRNLKKLKTTGYIIKKTDPQDKRKNLIYLTNKAHNFEKKFKEILTASEEKIKANLSTEEIKTFLHVIKKICSNFGAEFD